MIYAYRHTIMTTTIVIGLLIPLLGTMLGSAFVFLMRGDMPDRVREFVKNNPTVYLSTHCPEGYENLEMNRVMKL